MSISKSSTRLLALWTVATILILGLAATVGVLMREPTFEGRTIRSWVTDAAYGRGHANANAAQFFKRNGSRTVPDLIPIIEGRGLKFAQWLSNHKWLFRLLPSRVQKWATKKTQKVALALIEHPEKVKRLPFGNDARRSLSLP